MYRCAWVALLVLVGCTRSHPIDGVEGARSTEMSGTVQGGLERPEQRLPVLDTPAPDGLSISGQRERFGLISDPPHPIFDHGVVRHYEIEVDPDDWARINREAYLEEYIRGELHFEDTVVQPVGLRFKGFRGSLYNCFRFDEQGRAQARTCSRLSLKLSFNEYDPEGRFYGLKKLNFHSMNNDPTKLRERLAYWLFRQYGVPAPRAVHATLSVNGEDLGLYDLVEQVDGRFTRHRFLDGGEGNLYKERWPMASTDEDYFLSGLKTNEHDPDVEVDKMVDFARALKKAEASETESVLDAHTDLDALMRYLAVDRAIDHWDGITAFRCRAEEDVPPLPPEVRAAQTPPLGFEVCQNKNFYVYEEAEGDRHWLVAWDTDVTFPFFPHSFPAWDEEPMECPVIQSGRPPGCDPLIRHFATSLRKLYVHASAAFVEGPFEAGKVERRVRRWWEQIAPYVQPGLFGAANVDSCLRVVNARRQAFLEEIQR